MESVKKREVFYLSGYDPRGARHYYNLYKEESLKELPKGYEYHVGKRTKNRLYDVCWKINLDETDTNYHFLEWDDIIRARWDKSFLSLFADMLYVLKAYVLSGVIIKYAKASPVQMIAAFYPVVYLLGTVAISFIAGIWLYDFLKIGLASSLSFLLISVMVFFSIFGLTKLGNRFAVFWLLRVYTFSARYVEKEDQILNERIEKFAEYIVNSLKDLNAGKIDEVLIVSHSVGTIMLIPVLAEVFSKIEIDDDTRKKISVLTLGECIPVVSFLPKADFFREKMKQAVKGNGITWLDFTTPIDGACFPLLDFYESSNVCVEQKEKPSYLSPRFHTLFPKKYYRKLKSNRYLTHFIYMMSTPIDGTYNFFKMTAGNKRLKAYNKPLKEEE